MDVVALIATVPRVEELFSISLPSLVSQIKPPDAVFLIQDHSILTDEQISQIKMLLSPLRVYVYGNSGASGAAGSWNTGIEHISKAYGECYIAILDDDDSWHPEHLRLCLSNSNRGASDLVLSGIEAFKAGKKADCLVPNDVRVDEFLVGNPGWQGSNTFIKLSTLKKVGGFTDGLISCNDRDLAIRVLSDENLAVSYTNQVSVRWNFGNQPSALSAPGSPQKLRGCAQFLRLHSHRMTASQQDAFFHRMDCLFKLCKAKIIREMEQL